ncbi:MAG: sensor histidine kinase [Oscillatoriales cyanobacterium]|nr:MAG: sensor histidine kinase [Oscillatoriales cyanobacterium]
MPVNEVFFLCLGLGLGIVIAGWQRLKFERSLERLQILFPPDIKDTQLPPLWKLRRGMSWLADNNDQLLLEVECWRATVQMAPIGYLQVDRDNYLQRSNATARSILGLSDQGTITPRLLLELVRSYELDRLIEKTRKTQEAQVRCWTFYPTSASVTEIERCQPLALCGSSIILPNGHIGVWLENQQEMAELKESRDRWVADLAHELRTPLTSIKLVAETLEQRLEGTPLTWTQRLVAETDRLISLVQDWLDLTKLNTDHLREHQPFLLADLIDDVWVTLEPLAHRRGISLVFQEQAAFTIKGNRNRMFRVFLNLIDNAIQYSPDHQSISITIAAIDARHLPNSPNLPNVPSSPNVPTPCPEISTLNPNAINPADVDHVDHIAIDIIDSGSGFSEDDLPHVFERLYRGDRSRVRVTTRPGEPPARHTSGSGLGLAIVEQIIHDHNGTVTARNAPQGTGAWLQIILPTAKRS